MSKVIVIGALPTSLINFRGELIKSFIANDHQVIAMAAAATAAEEVDIVNSLGVKYIDYSVQRNGLNPFADIRTFLNFIKVFKAEKPDFVFAYTIKPVIWGGITARFFSNIQFYALITGLGFAFQKGGFKRDLLNYIATNLYRLALSKASKVIFQNPDNLRFFLDEIITKEKAVRVNGSGVDLSYFVKSAPTAKTFTFLTIARLLGEKGLREYAAAAKLVKQQYPNIVFQLVGPEDPSPDGIPITEVNKWHDAGFIEYLGVTEDVRPYLSYCNIFVLASYHEGMPRTVLEAMATGRPILTTNVAGCRETVIDGENGFLVGKQNVEQLVEKMLWFIENQEQWQVMADKSREIAIEYFDVHKVNEQLLKIMKLKKQKERNNDKTII